MDRSGHSGRDVYMTSTGHLLGDSLSRRRSSAWEIAVVAIKCRDLMLLRLAPLEVFLNTLFCKETSVCTRHRLKQSGRGWGYDGIAQTG